MPLWTEISIDMKEKADKSHIIQNKIPSPESRMSTENSKDGKGEEEIKTSFHLGCSISLTRTEAKPQEEAPPSQSPSPNPKLEKSMKLSVRARRSKFEEKYRNMRNMKELTKERAKTKKNG